MILTHFLRVKTGSSSLTKVKSGTLALSWDCERAWRGVALLLLAVKWRSPNFFTGAYNLATWCPSSASPSITNDSHWLFWLAWPRVIIGKSATLPFCAFAQFLNRSFFLCRKKTGQWVGFLFVVHSCLLWRIMVCLRVRCNFGPSPKDSGASLPLSQ